MSDLLLGDDLDLVLNAGASVLITENSTAVKQRLLIGLNTFRGRQWFDYSAGIPWVENENNSIGLLGKTDKSTVDIYVKELISKTYGVDRIDSYQSIFDYNTSQLTITAKVIALDGTVIEIANLQIGQ